MCCCYFHTAIRANVLPRRTQFPNWNICVIWIFVYHTYMQTECSSSYYEYYIISSICELRNMHKTNTITSSSQLAPGMYNKIDKFICSHDRNCFMHVSARSFEFSSVLIYSRNRVIWTNQLENLQIIKKRRFCEEIEWTNKKNTGKDNSDAQIPRCIPFARSNRRNFVAFQMNEGRMNRSLETPRAV